MHQGFNSFHQVGFLRSWSNMKELHLDSCNLNAESVEQLVKLELLELAVLELCRDGRMKNRMPSETRVSTT